MSERKQLTELEIKDDQKGIVQAVIATLNVIDKDGDVTVPGAFQDGAPVLIGAYGHSSWRDALPVGKGVIRETGDRAILDGMFFMDTTHGRDTFGTVKGAGALGDWSYGYDALRFSTQPDDLAQWPGATRILQKLDVHEVAPVLVGAGVDTGTLEAKDSKQAIPSHSTGTVGGAWDAAAAMSSVDAKQSALRAICAWVDPSGDANAKSSYKFPHHATPGGPANLTACSAGIAVLNGGRGGSSIPDGDRQGVYSHLARHLKDGGRTPPPLKSMDLSFSDDAEHALAHCEALLHRAGSLADLRAEDGRELGEAAKDRLTAVAEQMKSSALRLETLLRSGDCNYKDELLREIARFERIRASV